MSLTSDRGLGKRARRQVSERLRAYHDAVIRMVEADSEALLDRVIERARHEGPALEAAQAERAPI